MMINPATLKNLAEANAAAAGGLISTVSLYPLDILKTKLATAAKSDGGDTSIGSIINQTFQREGIPGFFAGVHYKALQTVIAKFLYFYVYSWLQNAYESRYGKMGTAANLVIGYLAEAGNLPLTMPIETLVTQVQTAKGSVNVPDIIRGIMKDQGILGFYRGYASYPFLCLQPAIQYTIFDQLKRILLKGQTSAALSASQAFILGAIARAIALFLVYPFIRVKTLMQAAKSSEKSTQGSKSILRVLAATAKKEGASSLFNGLAPEMVRGVLSSAVLLMVKERIQMGQIQLLMKFVAMRSK